MNANSRNLRRGETNPTMLIGLGIGAVVIVGLIIAFVVHRNNVERARTNSQKYIAACKELQGQIQQQKSPLTGAGLSFQPYQSRFDEAVRKQAEAEAVVERDPKQAEQIAGQAEGKFKSVLSDLHLAVQVKTDISGKTALSDAENRVASTRSQSVEFNYPGTSATRQENYRLDEAGNNPDSYLNASRRSLNNIDTQLNAGQPQDAAASLSNAKSEAASAIRCIDNAMSAKRRVEAQMSVTTQKSEDSDSSYIDGVKQSYFEQNFVTAANRMDSLNKRIEDRKEARELVAFCERLSRDVGKSVQDNADYVSTATDARYQSLKDQLNGLADGIKQSNANWADLKAAGQRLEKGLNEVRDAAVQSRRDYDDAVFAVKSFRRDYEEADRNGTPPLTFFSQSLHPDVTDAVKEKVKDVNAISSRVERQIKLSKQDWKQIKKEAEEGSTMLKDLRNVVQEDNKKLEELSKLKEQLRQVTGYNRYQATINGRSFNSADTNRRDGDFQSHVNNAQDRYDSAVRAWRAGEKVGYSDSVKLLKQEISTVNNIGWYNMLRMMRTSSDPVAQRIAWNNGFRDDKSRSEWVDGFVSKRATGPDGLWEPDVKNTNGGSGDFGPPPDFNAPLPN